MEHPSQPGQLLRRGFLTGLVGVCSGCLLAGCAGSPTPLGGTSRAAAPSLRGRAPSSRRPTASPPRSPGTPPSDAGGRTPSSGGSTTPSATTDPTTKPRPTTGGDPTKRPGGGASQPPAPEPSTGPRPTRSPSPTAPAQSQLAAVSEVPVGGGLVLKSLGIALTQPAAGDIRAFSAHCTHQGCLVNASGGELRCPCHTSRFAITDGAVLGGPAPSPLPVEQILVSDGYVYLV